jgi:hypothetical protein
VLWIHAGFNAVPDPAFSEYGSRSRVLMTKNGKKFTAEKQIIYLFSVIY